MVSEVSEHMAEGNNLTVITTHTNADFDAMAAMLAAQKLYPNALVVFPGGFGTIDELFDATGKKPQELLYSVSGIPL